MFRVKYTRNKNVSNTVIILNIETNTHGTPIRSVGVGGEVKRYILEKVNNPRPKVVESINRTVAQAADRA